MTVRVCWWRKLETVIDLPQVTDKPDNIKVWFDGSLAQAAAVINTTYVQRKSKQFKKFYKTVSIHISIKTSIRYFRDLSI